MWIIMALPPHFCLQEAQLMMSQVGTEKRKKMNPGDNDDG